MTDLIERRQLGMDRQITRRDFLNGVAIAVGSASLGSSKTLAQTQTSSPGTSDYYPPALTGLRGSHPGSFEVAHMLRDGGLAQLPDVTPDAEIYDLVVVGAGISGLAAAFFFRQVLGPDQRVLLLDNHDDFGGHAKRNEFRHEGRTIIGYGGTMSIETPFPYSFVAKSLLHELGVQVERYHDVLDRDLYKNLGLSSAMFFDREHFGEDRLVTGYGSTPWREFFERAPLTDRVRQDLIRIHTADEDYLSELGEDEKRARLARISYQQYLMDIARVSADAIPFFTGIAFRNNMRVDTVPALHAARYGAAGFDGLKLKLEPVWPEDDFYFHFPDGNASIARLLVKRLIPRALEGDQTMESIVTARLQYGRLDESGSAVRLRLNSTAVRVEHEGSPGQSSIVRVVYMNNGQPRAVRARTCVLACYNAIVRYLVPDLPEKQKQALAYPVKVPMMYTNVFIRNWKAFEKLGVSRVSAPNMYHTLVGLDVPVSMGQYTCTKTPDQPIVLHLVRNPNKPGLPRREQQREGMRELFTTSFEQMELETRRELARILGPGGFDPATDMLAMTANRWPHGYAYTYDSISDPPMPENERPHVVGRQPFGLVAIANSDAGAAAFTNTAIDEAHRAVQELLARKGLR
jgi:spermidine dehydrogenase